MPTCAGFQTPTNNQIHNDKAIAVRRVSLSVLEMPLSFIPGCLQTSSSDAVPCGTTLSTSIRGMAARSHCSGWWHATRMIHVQVSVRKLYAYTSGWYTAIQVCTYGREHTTMRMSHMHMRNGAVNLEVCITSTCFCTFTPSCCM